ncbi:MAG: GNAT family N-acetyltransferase [Dehalococcoidales bacterium]|nr:MAG: GNAT family N-acetyltransferase [Dehalococcoidales bacterium]
MAIIRAATEKDIPRVLDLYRELVITTSEIEQKRNLSLKEYLQVYEQIKAMPDHELLVAEDEGEVIGSVVLLIVPNLSHGASPWAVVENIIVTQKHRRRGVGRQLMEYAITRAREAGCYEIQLSSNKRRRGAHRFYGGLGFQAEAHGFRRYF